MKDVRPDDVPRSPSGRVPRWVIDEARGVEPVDRVPFRSATTSETARVRRSRTKQSFRVALTLGTVVGLLAVASALGWSPLTGVPRSGEAAAGRAWAGPPLGHEEAKHARGEPEAPVGDPSSSYRFAAFQADGTTPVTWSPCRPIHYVMRPDHAPEGGAELLATALARVSRATGLKFVNDGPTSEGPSQDRSPYQEKRYGDRWAPVLLAWATPDEVPDFGVDIAGEAAGQRMTTGSGDFTYVTGEVYLDAAKIASMLSGNRPSLAQDVVLHELGHLVGLAHVNDAGQIMAARPDRQLNDFRAGDLAGLARLGTGPCQPDA